MLVAVFAGAGVKTCYSHLRVGAPAISCSRCQIIGPCGNKGRWSTIPHLHFEAEPLHLLDVLKSASAEQVKSMEQTPQWHQRSVEASRLGFSSNQSCSYGELLRSATRS